MNKRVLLHEYFIFKKGLKKKIFYQFSDSHLCEWDENSSAEEKSRAQKRTDEWYETRRWFTDKYNEPLEKEQEISAAEHYNNLISVCSDADGVLIAGDTMDYVSQASLNVMEQGLKRLKIPFVAVCGNHESVEEIPDGMLLSCMKDPVYVCDTGDILLVGINNSNRKITEEQFLKLEEIFSLKKPIILTMHIPIMTNENREILKDCGEYFYMEESANKRLRDMIIRDNSPVLAVLTGHLHFTLNNDLGGVMQYGSSQGIAGNINKFIIGEF